MYVFLSAAHCVTMKGEPYREEDFIVYLGRHNLRNMNEYGLQYKNVSTLNIISYTFPIKHFRKFQHCFPRCYLFIFSDITDFFFLNMLCNTLCTLVQMPFEVNRTKCIAVVDFTFVILICSLIMALLQAEKCSWLFE